MPPAKKATSTVYQLKITLSGARPPIWRRVQVASDITLGKLHKIIQRAMGWYECHMHEFDIFGEAYGEPMPEYDLDIRSERNVRLNQVVTGEKFKFSYIYDMGDGWDHKILVEKVLPADPEVRYPICIKGKRACPPEDCGGIWGYAEFLEAIQTPDHPEHESMLEWVDGEFDPEHFDLEETNQQLKGIR
ncbi:plasmid pRiA4b ORF-3 family protein [Romeria aff. gracilis LEGE 07310]|uniref:Plasmid pRiA4b ORF-3 family protein n=1 Tax=Vasconcelosia minhoensis LEGE 07310 TaxID=915328 RepID=A0A8J7DQ69_9CYAN|nr:plasmid pRiA4b ORF-3 family protein [Romeria gracilis]MBE9076009.1 plasmid pRiA4b ORF-3 family protein [Romeria aff. gracilis LEGE 07310]